MRILWLATKSPWPSVDGGRLLMARTIEALSHKGHEIHVLAPSLGPGEPDPSIENVRLEIVESKPTPSLVAAALALVKGQPTSAVRHRHRAVARRADQLLRASQFDAIHVEQVQAVGSLPNTVQRPTPVPVILRAQNVESELWKQAAERERPLFRAWLAREGRALADFESRALGVVDLTLALTQQDQHSLQSLAPDSAVGRLRAPFPASLPPADQHLEGAPALVILGDTRWRPNRDGLKDFLTRIWPRVREQHAGSKLHLFAQDPRTPSGEAIECHGAPRDSREAFARNAILVVPLRIASGVRMKILESWARGIPVVASSIAAAGLDATHREHLFVADDADGFNRALTELQKPEIRERMVDRARTFLAHNHDPNALATELADHYRSANQVASAG